MPADSRETEKILQCYENSRFFLPRLFLAATAVAPSYSTCPHVLSIHSCRQRYLVRPSLSLPPPLISPKNIRIYIIVSDPGTKKRVTFPVLSLSYGFLHDRDPGTVFGGTFTQYAGLFSVCFFFSEAVKKKKKKSTKDKRVRSSANKPPYDNNNNTL